MKRQYQILVLAILALSVLCISCSDLKRNTSAPTSSVSENYSPYTCNACHGNATNAAPPKDLEGNTSTSSPGVGAHQAHLLASHTLSAKVGCTECHTVPALYSDVGHLDLTAGAELSFQGDVVTSNLAALAGPAHPAYSRTTLKCDNTYCHGYFPNGNKAAPVWTDVSGQNRACGSCHGDPSQTTAGSKALPKTSLNGGTHPNNTNCSQCHTIAITSSYQFMNAKHINGKLDFN
jgi:predicted CxxxxCH...CXXCH cytochrome family protein